MILSLDIAHTVGIAWGGVEDGSPKCTTVELPRGPYNLDRAFAGMHETTMAMCTATKPQIVCIEAPLPYVKTDAETSFMLNGLAACARAAAQRYGARIILGNVQTVRAYFVGNGRPEDPKAVVMRRCEQLRWTPKNTDEGDACALWAWGMATNYPKWSIAQAPLFKGEI